MYSIYWLESHLKFASPTATLGKAVGVEQVGPFPFLSTCPPAFCPPTHAIPACLGPSTLWHTPLIPAPRTCTPCHLPQPPAPLYLPPLYMCLLAPVMVPAAPVTCPPAEWLGWGQSYHVLCAPGWNGAGAMTDGKWQGRAEAARETGEGCSCCGSNSKSDHEPRLGLELEPQQPPPLPPPFLPLPLTQVQDKGLFLHTVLNGEKNLTSSWLQVNMAFKGFEVISQTTEQQSDGKNFCFSSHYWYETWSRAYTWKEVIVVYNLIPMMKFMASLTI